MVTNNNQNELPKTHLSSNDVNLKNYNPNANLIINNRSKSKNRFEFESKINNAQNLNPNIAKNENVKIENIDLKPDPTSSEPDGNFSL